MNGGFSLIGLVIWILILAGIFWLGRITPWFPVRIALQGIAILLAVLGLVQIVWLVLHTR